MIFTTVTPMRLDGRPIRDPSSRSAFLGTLELASMQDVMPGRVARVLYLRRATGPGGRTDPLLPPLIDAELVSWDSRGAVFRGVEEQGKDRHVAQSWRVEFHAIEPPHAHR